MSNVQISLESGDSLDVRTFSVHEALSASFQIDVIALGVDDLDLSKISGRPAAFALVTAGGPRVWTGVCARASQLSVEPDGLSRYSLQIVPAFWLLLHRRNHRVFQHLSAPEIVQKLLAEWHIPVSAQLDAAAYPKREMTVQYGESDHDFVRRLLAANGISYYFRTPEGEQETKLFLVDNPTSAPPRQPLPFMRSDSLGEGAPHVTSVTIGHNVRSGRAVIRDFDFRRPSYPLAGTFSAEGAGAESLLEDYYYVPGASLARADSAGSGTPFGDAEGAYRHTEKEANRRAALHTEALQGAARRVEFNSNAFDLAPGTVFSMTGHPQPDVANGAPLLVLSSFISGEVNERWNGGGEAVSAKTPFRPLLTSVSPTDFHRAPEDGPHKPLSRIEKPRIAGLQSAIVVGPKGEDIHVDEHGRVRLQFPWDREAKGDEHGSAWVRVAQQWAGPGFGMIAHPRVGQEVLLAFQEGDPDLPVVVGRMFDTTSPVPYAVPEHKTRTSLKSSSRNGGNEITFDDKADGELFYLQATKDLHKIVAKDELERTKGNRHVTVDGDLVLSAKGNVIIQAGKELFVKGGPKVNINPPGEVPSASTPSPLSGSNGAPAPKPADKPAPKPADKPAPKPADKPAPAKSTAAQQNDQLFKVNPGGPTGKFNQLAAARKAQAEKYQALAKQIGEKYNIPPALALAWMNRESAFGDFLNSSGYSKFDGQGFGLFQVDKRFHTPVGGAADWDHIDQAMGIYKSTVSQIKAAHPGWSEEQYMAAGLVGYNSGPGNANTQPTDAASWAQLDGGTAHVADPSGDYSRDVWTEAQWYARNLKW